MPLINLNKARAVFRSVGPKFGQKDHFPYNDRVDGDGGGSWSRKARRFFLQTKDFLGGGNSNYALFSPDPWGNDPI